MRFRDYLIESKVEALLRLRIYAKDGAIPSGYRPVREFFPTKYADDAVARRCHALADAEKQGRLPEATLCMVDPATLIPTQYNVELETIRRLIANGGATDKPIVIARYQGRLYIVNGHHRAAADIAMGKQSAAKLIDLS